MRLKFIVIFLFMYSSDAFSVERIIECTQPSGMSFDLKTPENGWRQEDLHVSGISFIKEHADHYDILIKYKERTDIINPSGNGYSLTHSDESDFSIVVSTRPLGIIETFHVHLDSNQTGTLIWSIMKNNTPPMKSSKSSTFIFKCVY